MTSSPPQESPPSAGALRRRSDPTARGLWILVAFFVVLFLAQQLGGDTYLFSQVLTGRVVTPLAVLSKLAFQIAGCVYGARCALSYEKGNPVRPAWMLVSAWLGFFALGQLALGIYEIVLMVPTPIPSVGDAFFLLGYACVIAAIVRFVAAYRASGFAVGRLRDHAPLGLAACVVFAVVSYGMLLPIALGPTPLAERIINVGYPLLDLVLLIPALVLLRITVRFQGGRVWPVWAWLLTGIVFSAGADILFADVTPEHLKAVGPLVDLLFILSYLASANGTRLQLALLTE